MDYKEKLNVIEFKIESLIEDLVEDKIYKSPRTEEKLTSLCLSREYLKDKIKEKAFIELNKINAEITTNELKTICKFNEEV